MLGYESEVVNGQLVNVAPKAAYSPLVFGTVYTGSAWPRQGVYTVPPVIPSPAMQNVMAPSAYGGTAAGGPVTSPFPTATGANGNPYSLTKSPVLWVIIFLGFALFMLHKVHWS